MIGDDPIRELNRRAAVGQRPFESIDDETLKQWIAHPHINPFTEGAVQLELDYREYEARKPMFGFDPIWGGGHSDDGCKCDSRHLFAFGHEPNCKEGRK